MLLGAEHGRKMPDYVRIGRFAAEGHAGHQLLVPDEELDGLPCLACELQAIQRSQSSPKFDLKDIGSSALRIVLALPNGAELIKERVMKDFLARRRL